MILRTKEHSVLAEALRRRCRFNGNDKQSILKQWTGLGCATEYKQAVQGGYMEHAQKPNPGAMCWWKLTPKGAAIVAYWIGLGHNHVSVENSGLPPAVIPDEVV